MNESELLELHILLLDSISNVWELWIAITFAVIVATHFGKSILTKQLVIFASLLYFSTTLILLMRYIDYLQMIADLTARMSESGVTPLDKSFGLIVSVLSVLVLSIGSLTTIGFGVWQYRRAGDA